MVLIDAARYGLLDRLCAQSRFGVAALAAAEVQYWKDADGERHMIDLTGLRTQGRIEVISATAEEIVEVLRLVSTRALGHGELESLALVRARGMRFCTADRAAIRVMRGAGLQQHWVSFAELLSSLDPPVAVPDPKYVDERFQ
jgi:hypothetical protein